MSDDESARVPPPLVHLPDAVVSPGDTPAPSLFERIGGRLAVESLVDHLYDGIEADPALRPLFPADLTAARLRQQWFFEEWLGGERRFTARRGSPRLRQRHLPFAISRDSAERWLRHMQTALTVSEVDSATASEIMRGLTPLARHFVNTSDE